MNKYILYFLTSILVLLFSANTVQATDAKYIKVEEGYGHVVAVKDDGTVWAWGDNSYGCLGDGTDQDRLVPTKVEGIDDVVDVAVGYFFTIALKSDGTVWGWGWNVDNRLGLDVYQTSIPMKNNKLKDIVEINADDLNSYALGKDGTNYKNSSDTVFGFKHKKASPEKGTVVGFKVFASRYNTALGIKNDNTVWKWGINKNDWWGGREDVLPTEPKELKEFNGAKDVAVGNDNLYIICSDGRLVSYGNNHSGQLGNGFTSNINVPQKIEGVEGVKNVSANNDIYIIHNDGSVSILYDVNKEDRLKKVAIDDVDDIMQTENDDVYALKKDGTVWTWQSRPAMVDEQALSIVPKCVSELSDIVSIFNTGNFEGAIDSKGRVFVKNYSMYMRYLNFNTERNSEDAFDMVTSLGDNNYSIQFLDFDILINMSEGIANISIGRSPFIRVPLNESNIFVKLVMDSLADGQSLSDYNGIVCSLKIKYDQLLGKYISTLKRRESLEDSERILDIEKTDYKQLILKEDGTVRYTDTLEKVQGLTQIKSVAGGGAGHYFAIDSNDNLYAWGNNGEEELFTSEYQKNQKQWNEVARALISLNIDQPTIFINGREKSIPTPPIILDSRTMIPIREVVEGLGGTVEWNEEDQKVTITLSNNMLSLFIDSVEGELNGINSKIEIAPRLINGKTYLPLRYVCESLGAKVLWEGLAQKITIVY